MSELAVVGIVTQSFATLLLRAWAPLARPPRSLLLEAWIWGSIKDTVRPIEDALRRVRLRRTRDILEDTLQEARLHLRSHVFEPMMREDEELHPVSSRYLKRAIRNLDLDLADKRAVRHRWERALADDALPDLLAQADPADEAIGRVMAADHVARLREDLTPQERRVLALRQRGDKDSDIAKRWGKKTATVNTLRRRIAAKARRLGIE